MGFLVLVRGIVRARLENRFGIWDTCTVSCIRCSNRQQYFFEISSIVGTSIRVLLCNLPCMSRLNDTVANFQAS